MSARDRQIAAAVAVCLLGFYLLTFSGRFHSSDGLSMYAAADSLVRYGRLDTEQIRWMGLQQGSFGPDGRLYSRKGAATTFLALPLVWLGMTLPDIGPVHAALLLAPLLTALAGLYLFLAVRRTFSGMALPTPLAPLTVTLVWGLGSMAWPYTKTFFSEPVVALTLIAAAYHLVKFRDTLAARQALWSGAWLGLGLLARSANAIVVPLYSLTLLWYLAQDHGLARERPRALRARWRQREVWQPVLAFVVPVVVAGLLSLLYNAVRFGTPFESGYLEAEQFSAFWPQGILGELLSPGRGLLWYTPWILALIPAVPRAWRRDQAMTALALGTALVYVLFYGKWYMWHGGFAWGPRFLVPVLPLLALLAAPLFDRSRAETGATRRYRRAATGFLLPGTLGILINLIGVAWDFMPHQNALDAAGFKLFDPVTFFNPRWAQIPGVLALGSPATLDVIWVADGQVVGRMLLLAAALALVGLSVLLLTLSWRTGPWVRGGLALMAVGTWLLLGDARALQSPVYRAIVERLETSALSDAVIWHDDPVNTAVFLNLYRGRLPILGLNVAEGRLEEEAARAVRPFVRELRPVWLISDGPDRQGNALDGELLGYKFPAQEQRVDTLRLALYYDGSTWSDSTLADVALALPGAGPLVRLDGYRYTPIARRGGVVALDLSWEALRPISEDYQVFVHLVPAAAPDTRVAQEDGPAGQGLRPTSTWQVGEVIRDRHAVVVPPQVSPGTYSVRVGLYRLSDLARLAPTNGADAVEIGPIEIR